MQNKQNSTLRKDQHTKSMPDLHVKGMGTDLSISDTNTRASTPGSVNGDYSDEDSVDVDVEHVNKKKLTGFAERINSNTKNLGVMGDARTKYSGVATAILGMIDANNDDYSKENKDDFFTAVRSQMQKSLGSNVTLKDEIWRSEFDRVFQNSSKGRNFLGILETNGVDTKTLEEEKLNLQQQMREDRKTLELAAEKAKQEAQKVQEDNYNLKNQVGTFESKLKEEQESKNRLEQENKKKTQDLKTQQEELEKQKKETLEQQRKLESEIYRLKPFEQQMQDLNSKIQGFEDDINTKNKKIIELKNRLKNGQQLSDEEKEKLNQQIAELNNEKQSLEAKRRKTQEEKKILEEENQKKANEKDALQQAIEKLNLQNQQSEQEKRSQADELNKEKLKNDKLRAEVETNKELAGGEEKAQNQLDQKSQQKDITFEPDSAKDKISGRAKEIGRALADNLFIIAAMIGTIMALMSGAGFAVIIVAAVTPMAGMMVNKGINMIADQIERSQKKKEKAENLERERSPNMSQKLNPDLQNMGQVSTNPEKNGDEELDKQSEGDEESLENESTRGSQNDEYQETELDDAVDGKKSDIGDDIEDSDRTSVKEGDFEDADIQKINDEIGEDDKVIVDFEAKNLNRAAEGRLNLDGTTGKFTTTEEVEFKNPSTIDGLDLDGAYKSQQNSTPLSPEKLAAEKAALKKQTEGYSPTLKTSEQIDASEIKSDGVINVDNINSEIKEDANVVQAPEFTEAEQKDKQIAKLLEKRKNIQQEHNQYKAAEKILNQKSYDLEQTIKDRKAKTVFLSKDIMNLQSKMNDAGMSDESEKLIGIIGFRKTMRQKELEANLKEWDLKIAAVETQIKYARVKLKHPDIKETGEKSKEYYGQKINKYAAEQFKLEQEKRSLKTKNDENNNLKNKKQEEEERRKNINESIKKLNDEYQKLRLEITKLQQEGSKIPNKEREVDECIYNRKEEIKKKAQEDAVKQKLQDEKTAKALEAKKLQEEKKEAEKLQAIQKKKEEKYEKELANAKKVKVEAYKKAGIMSTADKKAAEGKLESEALDKDHAAIRSQERKAQEDTLKQKLQERAKSKLDKSNQISGSKVVDNSQHELLEGLINADEIDLSGASDKHSAKSFVVDANQSPSSVTASQIQ